jgi:hypothetical protein
MNQPTAAWVIQVLGPIVFVGILVWAIVDTRRHRRLSLVSLALIAGTTAWWQEWYGDWGSYLLYNPHFRLLPWHSSLWTTPNKPWFVIPAYGWYYATIFPLMLLAISRVRQARPNWNRHLTTVLVALGLFYAWDLVVEGSAATFGWWSYSHALGAALNSSKGTFPLLFPILLFCLFGVVVTWIMDQRDDRGRFRLETVTGVVRIREGWRREVGRAGAWVAMLNIAYIACLIAPLVLWRDVWGPASSVVP